MDGVKKGRLKSFRRPCCLSGQKGGLLVLNQFGNAFVREGNQLAQFFDAERCTFGCTLDFDDFAGCGHDDVNVAVAA